MRKLLIVLCVAVLVSVQVPPASASSDHRDAKQLKIIESFQVDLDSPDTLTEGDNFLWITANNHYGRNIYKIDPVRGVVTKSFEYPISGYDTLTHNEFLLWAMHYGFDEVKFVKIEPSGGNVVEKGNATFTDSLSIGSISWGEGNLWVVDGDEVLYKFDPETGDVLREIKPEFNKKNVFEIDWYNYGIWFTDDTDDFVYIKKIDLVEGNVIDTYRIYKEKLHYQDRGGVKGIEVINKSRVWLMGEDNIYKMSMEPDIAPKAEFQLSTNRPHVGERITLNASESKDKDGDIVKYSWKNLDLRREYNQFGKIINYTFDMPGPRTITLKVMDNNGAIDTKSLKINIRESVKTPTETPSHTITPKDYGDLEFKEWSDKKESKILRRLDYIGQELDKGNLEGVKQEWSVFELTIDESLKEIKQIEASPEMRPAKKEFKLALENFSQTSKYFQLGIEESDEYYLDKADESWGKANEHLERYNNIISEVESPTPKATPSPGFTSFLTFIALVIYAYIHLDIYA